MRKTILYIIIFLTSFSCKKDEKKPSQFSKKKEPLEIGKDVDSIKSIPKTNPKTLEIPKEIGVVYVTAENGLTFRKKPDVNSEKLGKFELGSKLSVIGKTGEEIEIKDGKEKIKGEWIEVISKRYKWHRGYVFNAFIIDSAKADFSKIPVDVSFEFNFMQSNSKIDYKNIDLNLTETTFSEFNKYQEKEIIESKNHNESQLIKSSGNPQTGGYFIIQVKGRLYKFPCGSRYSRPCFIYEGFNNYFNAYTIGQLGYGIYQTFYLDKRNGSSFIVDSPYDNGNYSFYVSPTKNRLASISSIDYERLKFYHSRSVITIYDIENIINLTEIKKAYTYSSQQWEVSRMNWIDDKSFILEVYDKTKKDDSGINIPTNIRYLKAQIK